MANTNTTAGWQDLPLQSITVNTETGLITPSSTTNYGTLPSPAFPAGSGLVAAFPPDIAGSVYDGHAFVVRLAGKVLTAGSYTFEPKLYQMPASVIAAGTQLNSSNVPTGGNALWVGAATSSGGAGTQSFLIETKLFWDSKTKTLNGGVMTYQINNVNIAVGTPSGTAGTFQVITQATSVGASDLNFIPSFTFGTAGVNGVTVTEFVIDRA